MGEEETGSEIDRWLRDEAAHPAPDPPPDLVLRTLRRVRNWVLVGDLLRLVTLEGLWTSVEADDGDARRARERQDS